MIVIVVMIIIIIILIIMVPILSALEIFDLDKRPEALKGVFRRRGSGKRNEP